MKAETHPSGRLGEGQGKAGVNQEITHQVDIVRVKVNIARFGLSGGIQKKEAYPGIKARDNGTHLGVMVGKEGDQEVQPGRGQSQGDHMEIMSASVQGIETDLGVGSRQEKIIETLEGERLSGIGQKIEAYPKNTVPQRRCTELEKEADRIKGIDTKEGVYPESEIPQRNLTIQGIDERVASREVYHVLSKEVYLERENIQRKNGRRRPAHWKGAPPGSETEMKKEAPRGNAINLRRVVLLPSEKDLKTGHH